MILAAAAAATLLARCEVSSIRTDLFVDPGQPPGQVIALVHRPGKVDTWIDGKTDGKRVQFEKFWGVPDLDLTNCAKRLRVAPGPGEIVELDACLYYVSAGADMTKALDVLVQQGDAIPLKTKLRCELGQSDNPANGPCKTITFPEEIIPIDDFHRCSLGG